MKSDSISSQYTLSEETKQDLLMRSIKIIDIGYVTVIYFVTGAAISIIIDNQLGKFDPKTADKQSIFRVTIEIILHLWLLGFLNYIARNLILYIPFPLDGYKGFQHSKVKEVVTASTFSFALFFYQNHMRDKLHYFLKRVMMMKQIAKDNKKETQSKPSNVPSQVQLIDPVLQQSYVIPSKMDDSPTNQLQSRSIGRQQTEVSKVELTKKLSEKPRPETLKVGDKNGTKSVVPESFSDTYMESFMFE
jgi:hypothetical protein